MFLLLEAILKKEKINILLLGNAIFVRTTMEEKEGLVLTSRTVQVNQALFITLMFKHLVTFEDYINFKGDIPMSTYIDFEPADLSLGPEDKNMFAISYVIIFAFHRYLKLNRVISERSFGHSSVIFIRLTSLDYLTIAQISFRDKIKGLCTRS